MGGVGPGLSPGPWSFVIAYDHAIYSPTVVCARVLLARVFLFTHVTMYGARGELNGCNDLTTFCQMRAVT
jgi:hypothetical protein